MNHTTSVRPSFRPRWLLGLAATAVITGAVLLGNVPAAAQDDALLFPPLPFAPGTDLGAMAAADLNADGLTDLVFAQPSSDQASVYLGMAPLMLSPAGSVALGDQPFGLRLEDASGDGQLDVIAANAHSSDISIRLGLGNGGFAGGPDLPLNSSPTSFDCGDVNADGRLDLVVTTSTGDSVVVLLGTGGGDFEPMGSQPLPWFPLCGSLGDIDEDGDLDLAVATGFGIQLLDGAGDGTFTPLATPAFLGITSVVLLNDVDADGHLDVVADPQSRLVVSLGSGDFSFGAVQLVADGFFTPGHLLATDLDADGLDDVLVVDAWAARVAALRTLAGAVPQVEVLPASPLASAAAPVDWSSDPIPEIAVLDSAGDSLSLLMGLQGDAIASRQVFKMVGYLRSVAVGDLDNDGLDDVLLGWIHVPVSGPNGLAVMRGLGGGLLAAGATISNPPTSIVAHHLALGDFDGNGLLDIAQVRSALNAPWGGTLSTRLGLGNLSFGPSTSLASGSEISALLAADVDVDGAVDLVVGDLPPGSISILWGDGTGQFPTSSVVAAGGVRLNALAVGDVDRDGLLDLAAAAGSQATHAALLLFASGPRQFGPAQTLGAGLGPGADVALADMDGDQFLDVVVGISSGFALVPCPGGAPSTPLPSLGLTPHTGSLEIGDAGGDGVADVVLVDGMNAFPPNGQVIFVCGRGDGGFLPAQTVPTANGATRIGLADLDSGGARSVVAINTPSIGYSTNTLVVLTNGNEPTWKNLGNALAGSVGVPLLRGEGDPLAGQSITLSLTRARPGSPAVLVIGLSTLEASFKGGVMVPSLSELVTGLATSGAGSLVLSGAWPAGLPEPLTTYYQYWITDPAGPFGFSASNGLAGSTP